MNDKLQENGIHESAEKLFAHVSGQSDAYTRARCCGTTLCRQSFPCSECAHRGRRRCLRSRCLCCLRLECGHCRKPLESCSRWLGFVHLCRWKVRRWCRCHSDLKAAFLCANCPEAPRRTTRVFSPAGGSGPDQPKRLGDRRNTGQDQSTNTPA